ncbi:cellulase family glycosylhydrolase [Limibacter armeniacum]|uniref:cellulase family glycosylhydrolase n=1 Tax=Limibacter armeniacum TaxID=466084 RepID=UPI002FE53479
MKYIGYLLLTVTLLSCNNKASKNDVQAVQEAGVITKEDSLTVPGRWSKERINEWYAHQPWLVGCNYYPATAINQIDMWQASTWDPERIDLELTWAESIGMNTLRVYMHDMVWASDEEGLYKRMDQFLGICEQHGIRPWFVFFDDCHFPNPKLGEQPKPVKGYHNSGWMNSPARDMALRYAEGTASEEEVAQLKGYVQETIKRFKDDTRILMWELYNEPGRGNGLNGDMSAKKVKASIGDKSAKLCYDSFVWAREVNPSQPITSTTAGSIGEQNMAINKANADLHSIHTYGPSKAVRGRVNEYKQDGRPVIVSEWLARTNGSTVQDCLPVLKELNVGAVNWGFVSGKSGTIWPWTSRKTADGKKKDVYKMRAEGEVVNKGEAFPEPELWFHDLFRMDGTPYSEEEIKIFRELTGVAKKS